MANGLVVRRELGGRVVFDKSCLRRGRAEQSGWCGKPAARAELDARPGRSRLEGSRGELGMRKLTRRQAIRLVAGAGVLALFGAGGRAVWAQQRRGGRSSAPNAGTALRQLQQAQLELTRAQQRVQAAIRQRGRLKKQLEEEKKNDDELKQARRELELARQEQSQARHRVLVLLEDDPRYKKAAAAVAEAEKQLKELQSQEEVDEAAVAAQRRELARLQSVVRAVESEALKNDPDYQRAKRKVAAASRRLAEVSKRLDEKYRSDPRLKAAEEEIARAKQAVAEATQRLAEARQNLLAAQVTAVREWQRRVYQSLVRRWRWRGRRRGRRRRRR